MGSDKRGGCRTFSYGGFVGGGCGRGGGGGGVSCCCGNSKKI